MKPHLKSLILITITLLNFAGCSNPKEEAKVLDIASLNFSNDEFMIFQALEEPYEDNNQLVFNCVDTYYAPYGLECYEALNYMPKNIYDEYGFGLYLTKMQSKNGEYQFYDHFLYFDEKIHATFPFRMSMENKDECKMYFSQCLITDINNDGYKEITITFQEISEKISNYTYVSCLDTASKMFMRTPFWEKSICIKENEGKPFLYSSEFIDKEISSDIIVETEIRKQNREIILLKENCEVISDNYTATIKYDPGQTTFPIYFDGLDIRYYLDIDRTYTGETFHMYSPSSPEPGAYPILFNDSIEELTYEPKRGIGGQAAIVERDVDPGDVLSRNYWFYFSEELSPNGVYNLKVTYRNESQIVPNFLEIRDKA